MKYLRDMTSLGGARTHKWNGQVRLSAILLAAALAVAACASETADSIDGEATGEEAVEGTPRHDDSGHVSIGDREAGFGPGSLVVQAGQWAGRLTHVEGEWLPGPPIELDPPDVCAIGEPEAIQGLTLVRPVDAPGVRADVISAEVRVYATTEEAEALVDKLNGEFADECDAAGLDRLLAADAPPGITYNFGDGIGDPSPVPDRLPDGLVADSRSFTGEVIFGTVAEPLLQKGTVVADGRFVMGFSVTANPEHVDALEAEVIAVLFSASAPEAIDVPDLDIEVDQLRQAVLSDDDLPQFYESSAQMFVGGQGQSDRCFTEVNPTATSSGPGWLAISPGVGVSELRQTAEIYRTSRQADAAFEEGLERGVECFPAQLNLSEMFEVIETRVTEIDVDGRRVLLGEIDLIQSLGGQTFDVEAKIAATQVDETVHNVLFFGLAGDSPDLASLVAIAATGAEQ